MIQPHTSSQIIQLSKSHTYKLLTVTVVEVSSAYHICVHQEGFLRDYNTNGKISKAYINIKRNNFLTILTICKLKAAKIDRTENVDYLFKLCMLQDDHVIGVLYLKLLEMAFISVLML